VRITEAISGGERVAHDRTREEGERNTEGIR